MYFHVNSLLLLPSCNWISSRIFFFCCRTSRYFNELIGFTQIHTDTKQKKTKTKRQYTDDDVGKKTEIMWRSVVVAARKTIQQNREEKKLHSHSSYFKVRNKKPIQRFWLLTPMVYVDERCYISNVNKRAKRRTIFNQIKLYELQQKES